MQSMGTSNPATCETALNRPFPTTVSIRVALTAAVLGRLTLRCSGREKHKVHAAGVEHHRAHGRYRARVLEGRWPAAELGS